MADDSDNSFPIPLTGPQIALYFGGPGPVPPNTFELALVLGGTVAAGAYTAGVLDFLIEALDLWEKARAAGDPAAPTHRVIIKAIVGTSGGGVNAAIAARALAYDFKPVVFGSPDPKPDATGAATGNPFYDTWVNRLDLTKFLGTKDLDKNKTVVSLLDGTAIDEGAQAIETFTAAPRSTRVVISPDPLRVTFTVTNLRGVPYRIDFGGTQGESYVDHADYGRFAVVYPGHNLLAGAARPDEFVVGFGDARLPQMVGWETLGMYARGTSAFPGGISAALTPAPVIHYNYRVGFIPGAGAPNPPAPPLPPGTVVGKIVGLTPDWAALADNGVLDDTYDFTVVDGGATDNEPIELARTMLAGVDGRNPRNGMTASRAVLLVDPFGGGGAQPNSDAPTDVLTAVQALVGAMIQQTRYDSRDILLALDPTVFSRFMIAAKRGTVSGDKALATAGMGAFLGFVHRDFRRHDYFLGRANCQAYLQNELMLPTGAAALGTGYAAVPGATGMPFLPIIPLLGAAAIPETPMPWPTPQMTKFKPEDLRDQIETRAKAVLQGELNGFLGDIGAWVAAEIGENFIATKAITAIRTAAENWASPILCPMRSR